MDTYRASQLGGFKCLLVEAIPAISASTQIFANAPATTAWIEVTILGQAIWFHFGNNGVAGTAVASAGNGNKLAVGEYAFVLSEANAKLVRAIQDTTTATGTISYWTLA